MNYRRTILILLLPLFLVFPIFGQNFDVSFLIDWVSARANIQISYNLNEAGIRLPTGRLMAEEIMKEAGPRLLRPHLFSILADSNSVLGDLVERRELSIQELDAVSKEAGKTPPSLSTDLSRMIDRYTLNIEDLGALLIKHDRAVEPERPLIPVQTAGYTGIIIIADEELPVQGRNSRALATPCIFPKVWDTGMNLVYERNMIDPNLKKPMVLYAARENIFRPTPSGLDGDLAALLGANPLRIIARGIFGANPTDLVIDREDSLKILSSDNNRRLLREGRVAFVLSETVLR